MIYDSRCGSGCGQPYTEEDGAKGPQVNSGVALMSMLFER